MGTLFRSAQGASKHDTVVATGALNLALVEADELFVWVGSSIRANQVEEFGMIEKCVEAIREAGLAMPATGNVKIADHPQDGEVATPADSLLTWAEEGSIAVGYGATFTYAASTLIFDAQVVRVIEAILEASKLK